MAMIRKFALTAGVIAVVVLGLFVFCWYLYMPHSKFNRVGCDWIKECPPT